VIFSLTLCFELLLGLSSSKISLSIQKERNLLSLASVGRMNDYDSAKIHLAKGMGTTSQPLHF